MKSQETVRLLDIGVWVWGAVTIFLAFGLFALVVCAAFHMDIKGELNPTTDPSLAGALQALKAYGSMLGAVVGFSGLAWANFFQAASKSKSDELPESPVEISDSEPEQVKPSTHSAA